MSTALCTGGSQVTRALKGAQLRLALLFCTAWPLSAGRMHQTAVAPHS